ncbi:DGQHR domain-containing protein [Pandoraea pulmonicola]|uniref:DGQHR domain n=1 Tax=Pandoraea pulmonicola TaxID=93221 RepID=A0AAJ4ZDN7_PANPU|nr:DNA sulfur modification protein DndB [Pandoraea pulmonicola]SUA91487.1 DGQHR domain [Pandoraea pulmonicola]
MPSRVATKSNQALALPALRGTFGDWTYYSAVVSLPELARRVSFGNELHNNKELSAWIQRSLKGGRADEIADYLRKEPERFFNSLVIALYGGTPEWVPLALQEGREGSPNLGSAAESLGILELSGSEELFAVDGQHRLAGMKRLMESPPEEVAGAKSTAISDLVSVLFIAHRVDRRERTRRLFTTLNKTAIPVSKMERIALDENDVMSIAARRMVEDHAWFQSPRIALHHTNNLGSEDSVALTTIGNLYDVLRELFLEASGAKKKDLEYNRPPDAEIERYYKLATKYFERLSVVEPALAEYFNASDLKEVCQRYRSPAGGSVYFRPMGLALMTEVAMRLKKEKEGNWWDWLALLPRRLDQAPFAGTIWSYRNTMDPKHRVLCRDLLLYMCGAKTPPAAELRARWIEVRGEHVNLPRRVKELE